MKRPDAGVVNVHVAEPNLELGAESFSDRFYHGPQGIIIVFSPLPNLYRKNGPVDGYAVLREHVHALNAELGPLVLVPVSSLDPPRATVDHQPRLGFDFFYTVSVFLVVNTIIILILKGDEVIARAPR
jgi:hypothetical protein